jgi:hypothetical protein
MTESTTQNRQDLGLLAINAAEELERLRKKLSTDLKSVNTLSNLLQDSFSKKIDSSGFNLRLDHALMFSNAVSNSLDSTLSEKTISEIADEAIEIASRLSQEAANQKEDDLQQLISFCVALSDSAALYKEEMEELRKRFA